MNIGLYTKKTKKIRTIASLDSRRRSLVDARQVGFFFVMEKSFGIKKSPQRALQRFQEGAFLAGKGLWDSSGLDGRREVFRKCSR